jgi:hypothetical protein
VEPSPDRTIVAIAIFAGAAVMLLGLVVAGADPSALSGVAAVITAIGIAVKRARGG